MSQFDSGHRAQRELSAPIGDQPTRGTKIHRSLAAIGSAQTGKGQMYMMGLRGKDDFTGPLYRPVILGAIFACLFSADPTDFKI